MKVTIICYARFRDIFGEETSVGLSEPATILDAVRALAHQTGPDSELLIAGDGTIREYVMIMHREARVFPQDAGSITLADGDSIILFPPVSGG